MYQDKQVTGIICECNPFHKGHKRLIDAAKKNSDIIIAVMSGNFVQRGEPAVYDKYKRTKDLLKNGVSIVIEMPLMSTLSSAKYFATSGIAILDKLKIVDNVMFGSKINDIKKLYTIADMDDSKVKEYIKDGMSYPKAMEKCFKVKLPANDILAVEYIRAIRDLKSKIVPISIKRKNDLPTATSLRTKIKKKIVVNDFSDMLTYKIISHKNFQDIYTVSKDLSNAILNTKKQNLSFEKRAKLLNTKNRTLANIKRAFLNIIFDIKENDVKKANYGKKVPYIRILGIKKEALPLLKNIKVPYLMSFANASYKDFASKFDKKILSDKTILHSIFSSDMYYLLSNDKKNESQKPVIIF